jgi:hypothetical protein
MPTTEAQKRANKKWRDTHKEQYNAIQLANNINFYHQHREQILAKKKEYYLKKKELKQLEFEISL